MATDTSPRTTASQKAQAIVSRLPRSKLEKLVQSLRECGCSACWALAQDLEDAAHG